MAGAVNVGPMRRASRAARWAVDHLEWLVGLLVAGYLILLLARLSPLIRAMNWDSDSSSAFVMADLLGPDDQVFGSTHGSWTTMWWYLLTKDLPGHRQIWGLTSPALMIATSALIAWAAWRMGGRRAALLAGGLSVAASPLVLPVLLQASFHNSSFFALALLAVYLLELTRRQWPVLVTAGAVLVVGVIVGTNLASDSFLLVAGILPFAAASFGLLLAQPGPRSKRVAWAAGATLVVTVIAAGATTHFMHRAGWHTYPPTARFLDTGALTRHVGWLLQTLVKMGNGDFFHRRINADSLLALGCAGLTVAALPIPAVLGWRLVRAPGGIRPIRFAYTAFWSSVWLLTGLSFVFSTQAVALGGERYLVPMLYSVAALIPLVRPRISPRWLTAGICLFLATSVVALAEGRDEKPYLPTGSGGLATGLASAKDQIVQAAKGAEAVVGYAGYWDAASLAWSSGLQVKVYPVRDCQLPSRRRAVCPFIYQHLSSWYKPKPRTRTFLIVDPETLWLIQPPPAELGVPLARHHFGTVDMYIYGHDIARDFHCPPGPGCGFKQ
jgi:hypothetical protein